MSVFDVAVRAGQLEAEVARLRAERRAVEAVAQEAATMKADAGALLRYIHAIDSEVEHGMDKWDTLMRHVARLEGK